MITDETDDYPGGWFGQNWGAPVCDENRHLPIPTGAPCLYCPKPISPDDNGLLIPGAYGDPNNIQYRIDAVHIRCFLYNIVGIDQPQTCRHCGDTTGHEDPAPTLCAPCAKAERTP